MAKNGNDSAGTGKPGGIGKAGGTGKRGFLLMRGRNDAAAASAPSTGSQSGATETDSLDPAKLPRHVAIIMDGNGRWAQERSLPRFEGHRVGAQNVRGLVEECRRLEIRYLTLFTFSTENWNRPRNEVVSLMKLFKQYLDSELQSMLKNNIRLRAIGDMSKLPQFVRETLERNAELTARHDGLDLILAISYGGREELVTAAKKLAIEARDGRIDPEAITERDLQRSLYAPDVPDPDLLIRTSDEHRISNFLLWQLAYSELVLTPVLWPDFSRDEFHRCLRSYAGRVRRFGLTSEQLQVAQLT